MTPRLCKIAIYGWKQDRKGTTLLFQRSAKIAKMDENGIGKEVVDAAIAVHREFGPGLLETVYEVILLDELRRRGLDAQRQVPIAIVCRGVRFGEAIMKSGITRTVNGLPE